MMNIGCTDSIQQPVKAWHVAQARPSWLLQQPTAPLHRHHQKKQNNSRQQQIAIGNEFVPSIAEGADDSPS